MRFLEVLFYSLIFSFCLGQFGKLPLVRGEANIYIWDILASFLVFYWLVYRLGVDRGLRLPPFWLPLFVFSFTATISLVNGRRWIGLREWLVSSGYLIRWLVFSGVYFVTEDLKEKFMGFRGRMVNVLILSGVILAFLGYLQLAVFPDLSELDPKLGWDPHQNRMVSTWLDPNFLGAYLVLSLSLLAGKLFDRTLSNAERPIIFCFFLLLAFALFLTFSRSAWAMFALVLGVFGIFKSRKLLILMLITFLGAYLLVPRVQTRISGITDPSDSASLRLISWGKTLEIIRKYPFLGVGFNAFRYAQERAGFFRDARGVEVGGGHAGSGSDSSLLLILATTGLCGFLSFLWLGGAVIRRLLQLVRNDLAESLDHRGQFLSLALLSVLVGVLLESNFINSLFFPPILIWFWIVLGLVVE